MESQLMFLDCPAYLDNKGTLRCGLPAEIQSRYIQRSTDGPLESAKIMCANGHWFNGPIEILTWQKDPDLTRPNGVAAPGPVASG